MENCLLTITPNIKGFKEIAKQLLQCGQWDQMSMTSMYIRDSKDKFHETWISSHLIPSGNKNAVWHGNDNSLGYYYCHEQYIILSKRLNSFFEIVDG